MVNGADIPGLSGDLTLGYSFDPYAAQFAEF